MVAETQSGNRSPAGIMWERRELDTILRIYGRMVAQGDWKDYAIDGLRDCAIFSIYRRTSEHPLYTVIKTPSDAQKQGMYKVVAMGGQILKRGRDLAQVLKVFDRKRFRLIG